MRRIVATHASAIKAHRQSLKRREHNREMRAGLRTAIKRLRTAIEEKNLEGAKKDLPATVSLIDKMAAKGIIHDNAAARHKSRLAAGIAKLSK
jgi:small subunit ribosomal protein S20